MVGTAAALGITGGAALLGGVAGALKNKSSTDFTFAVNAGSATDAETSGQTGMLDAFSQLQGMVGAGPGGQDVTAATDASRGYADMLGRYSQEGGNLPTSGDISSANGFANNIFAPQQVALQQSFLDQTNQANRQAAIMGRSIDDPILQAKMRTAQTQQTQMLNANQGAFAANFAMQQPGQRLGFAGQRAGVLGGLATQAMANRQAIAAMGEGIMNNERNFRMATASKFGNQSTESGGGLKGALTGFLGGAGTGMSIAGMSGFGGTGMNGLVPEAGTDAFNQGLSNIGNSYSMPSFGQQSSGVGLFSGQRR